MTICRCWMHFKEKKLVAFKQQMEPGTVENLELTFGSRLVLKWMMSGSSSNYSCSKVLNN